MPKPDLIWLSTAAFAEMSVEATLSSPLETGGVLMGRWTDGQPLVTSIVGPGPKAVHRTHGFSPDYEFQEAEIRRRFTSSGGWETYLGDWHTHPGESHAKLSRQDRQTLGRISRDPGSQAPRPLMIVLIGGPDFWKPGSFIASRPKVLPAWIPIHVKRGETRFW